MQRTADISTCRRYRFSLTRASDNAAPLSRSVVFVLCNPSTADDEIDDPTVKRGWAYTQAWGYDRMTFVNVNPYRSTYPKLQLHPPEWALEENDLHLGLAGASGLVIAAWGMYALTPLVNRAVNVLKYVTNLHYLALCVDGKTPKHPLYLSSQLQPVLWLR